MTGNGEDYASVDGDQVDFAKAYAVGSRFVIIRRSVTYYDHSNKAWRLAHDPTYARDSAAARAAGLVVGSYLFPAFGVGAPSVAEQVANFNTAGGEILKGVDLPPAFDLEFPGNGVIDTGRSQGECLDLTLEFTAAMTAAYGAAPLLYTSHVEVHDSNGLGLAPDVDSPQLANCPLWIKVPYRLRADQPVDQATPAEPDLPSPWRHAGWWCRQSQGDAVGAAGFSHTADVDDFHILGQANALGDPRVSWVQRKTRATADGVWGPGTVAALRVFQAKAGLVADAVVGLRTFAALAWSP